MTRLRAWMALLVAALFVVAPSSTGLHRAMQDGGVTPLRDAVWTDPDGTRRVGINGDGVAVFSSETYALTWPDLDQCGDPQHHRFQGMPWPYQGANTGHGSAVAGVVCGDGEMSDGRHRGVAFESRLFVYASCVVGNSPYCKADMPWYYRHNLRVSIDASSGHPTTMWRFAGLPADADALFVHSAGNEGGDGSENRATWTGDFQNASRYLRVAAANETAATVADYSSRGDRDRPATWPHLTAPGCVATTAPPGSPLHRAGWVLRPWATDCNYDDHERWLRDGRQMYSLAAGTSLAAPFAGGVAALMFQVHPDLSAPDARYLLTHTADPFIPADDLDGDGEVEPEEFYTQHGYKAGYGLINATDAVAAAHYMQLRPDASPEEAVDCSTTGETADGRLVLNPDGGGCPSTTGRAGPVATRSGPGIDVFASLAAGVIAVAVAGVWRRRLRRR